MPNWKGAQWLSSRVLDSRLRGCGFEIHRCHCVVFLSSAGPKGGPEGHVPPEEAVSALQKITHNIILRLYTVMHNWERLLI